jgi:hypothetical protein
LSRLMGTHIVQPLPVFKDDIYVLPPAVNSAMKGSLVEVHFSLKHYRIRKRDSKPFDSFTGLVEQIIILKPGEPRLSTSYKRKNILDGPYRPKPFNITPPIVTSVSSPLTTPIPGIGTSAPPTHIPPRAFAIAGPSGSTVNKDGKETSDNPEEVLSSSQPVSATAPTKRTTAKSSGAMSATKASTAGKRKA